MAIFQVILRLLALTFGHPVVFTGQNYVKIDKDDLMIWKIIVQFNLTVRATNNIILTALTIWIPMMIFYQFRRYLLIKEY